MLSMSKRGVVAKPSSCNRRRGVVIEAVGVRSAIGDGPGISPPRDGGSGKRLDVLLLRRGGLSAAAMGGGVIFWVFFYPC